MLHQTLDTPCLGLNAKVSTMTIRTVPETQKSLHRYIEKLHHFPRLTCEHGEESVYPERVHQQRLELGEEEGGGHLDRHEEAHRGGAHVHGHHLGRQQRGDHAVTQPVARVGNWKSS